MSAPVCGWCYWELTKNLGCGNHIDTGATSAWMGDFHRTRKPTKQERRSLRWAAFKWRVFRIRTQWPVPE